MTELLHRLALALWVTLLAASHAGAQEHTEAGPATEPASPAAAEELPPTLAPPNGEVPPHPAGSPATKLQPPVAVPAWPVNPPPFPKAPGPTDIAPTAPEAMGQWLDEVRTQRRSWEERRNAAKEAINARRRQRDPWGATKQDVMEQEVQRRRDAFREKVERNREAFRSRRPWSTHSSPWPEMPPPADLPDGLESGIEPPSPPDAAYPALPGWDNRWYFRGF